MNKNVVLFLGLVILYLGTFLNLIFSGEFLSAAMFFVIGVCVIYIYRLHSILHTLILVNKSLMKISESIMERYAKQMETTPNELAKELNKELFDNQEVLSYKNKE